MVFISPDMLTVIDSDLSQDTMLADMISNVWSLQNQQHHNFHMWDANNTLVNPDKNILMASATFTNSNTGVNWLTPNQNLNQKSS